MDSHTEESQHDIVQAQHKTFNARPVPTCSQEQHLHTITQVGIVHPRPQYACSVSLAHTRNRFHVNAHTAHSVHNREYYGPAVFNRLTKPSTPLLGKACMQNSMRHSVAVGLLLVAVLAATPAAAKDNEETAKQRFSIYAIEKLKLLGANLRFTKAKKEVVASNDANGNSIWISRYHTVNEDSLTLRVKPVQGNAASFMGIMKYARLTFECVNPDKSAAIGGEHQLVKRRWQTEIIRYENGRWK